MMTSETRQQLDVPTLVLEAVERCRDYLSPTPLEYSMYLSEQIEGEVWLKLDSMQRTASFKFRGAINKVLTLTEEELEKGVVSASTGNFALAVAEAMRIRDHRLVRVARTCSVRGALFHRPNSAIAVTANLKCALDRSNPSA